MNKKLKTLLFLSIAIVVVLGVGLGGYFLINNLATVTISDLRILAYDGTPIRDTDVFLQDAEHNEFLIKVKIESSGTNAVSFKSSDKSVANVVSTSKGFAVKYYKAGTAKISVSSAVTSGVTDSFVVNVHEDFVADLVIDGKADNVLEVYGNGKANEFDYEATGVLENSYANSALIRVVEDYDTEVIKKVEVDTAKKKVYIDTNLTRESSVQTINLQTYYIDSNGEEHVAKNFAYTLNVVGYDIKEIQLVISQDHYFSDKSHIFLSSDILASETDEQLTQHLVDAENESIVKEIYLTNDINTIYFLTRVLYTDGTYEYPSIESFSSVPPTGKTIYIDAKTPTNDSNNWAAQVNKTTVLDPSVDDSIADSLYIRFTIRKTIDDKSIETSKLSTFIINYLKEGTSKYNEVNNTKLYKYADGFYEYIYWDTRYRRTDAITDANGKIVDFDCPDEDKPHTT